MYYFQVPIYFNMHRNRRVNWGITHSLTPKISSKPELDWDNNHIPELPQRKKTYDTSPKNNFNPHN